MEIQKENKLYGPTGQPIAKGQIYGLFVDAAGDPVLDTSEEQQVVAIQSSDGKLQVSFGEEAQPVSVVGSQANNKETLTIDATVGGVALTALKYGTNTKAFITVETASIRYWISGDAPTSTEGHLLNAGDWLELDTADSIANFKAIRTAEVSATIQCTYLS